MRTLIDVAWTVHSTSVLRDALLGAELVGILPTHLVFLADSTFARAENLLGWSKIPLELYRDTFYRCVDKCDAYIAIQHNNDWIITAHVDYARKHGIPTAVWQL